MDLTGKYPVKSQSGHQYILIAYNFDANAILAEPLKNRKGTTITEGFKKLHDIFYRAGVAPAVWVLDNERSGELEEAFNEFEVQWQFVPPHTHRANLAERAIQTFKHHFKTGLSLCHPQFPRG